MTLEEGLVVCVTTLSEGSHGTTKKNHTNFPQDIWSAVGIRKELLQNCLEMKTTKARP
jgi:hypothetical protein